MDIESLRDYCLSLNAVTEALPFDENILAFFVGGKMFCLTDISDYRFINLKCDPELAIELREKHSEVTPGYHMNKKHWNSVDMFGNLSEDLIKSWILHSYEEVVKKLPKKVQVEIGSKL